MDLANTFGCGRLVVNELNVDGLLVDELLLLRIQQRLLLLDGREFFFLAQPWRTLDSGTQVAFQSRIEQNALFLERREFFDRIDLLEFLEFDLLDSSPRLEVDILRLFGWLAWADRT